MVSVEPPTPSDCTALQGFLPTALAPASPASQSTCLVDAGRLACAPLLGSVEYSSSEGPPPAPPDPPGHVFYSLSHWLKGQLTRVGRATRTPALPAPGAAWPEAGLREPWGAGVKPGSELLQSRSGPLTGQKVSVSNTQLCGWGTERVTQISADRLAGCP